MYISMTSLITRIGITRAIIFSSLELDDRLPVNSNNAENAENREDDSSAMTVDDNEIPFSLKRAYVIYQQAFERVKDIKFIIDLLNVTKEYNDTEKLQKKIIWYLYIVQINVREILYIRIIILLQTIFVL